MRRGRAVQALLLFSLGTPAVDAAAGPTVCAKGDTTPGIDVSKWQGTIGWAQVAQTQAFVIARVSDGTYIDKEFANYWPQIAAKGMIRGAYQFFEPATDAITQADILLKMMGPMGPGMLPPTLDVEASGGLSPSQVEAAVQEWVDYVTAKLGVAPMIYTGNWFWDPSVNSSAQASLPLWESYYCTNCCPKIPMPWTGWAIWQYSESGTVAGISGGCDMNFWNGDATSLEAFANGTTPVVTCGDGSCAASESCQSCAKDCGCASGEACKSGMCVVDYCAGYTGSDTCCAVGDPCAIGGDGICDCDGICGWESGDCAAGPVCGDGFCDAGEDCAGCSADCGDCPVADAGPTDTGAVDVGVKDSGSKDTGSKDTAPKDAGVKDSGLSGCTTDSQCAGVCDKASGKCVDCLVNADCPGGQKCLAGHVCASVCGDGACTLGESQATCCVDCPCPKALVCSGGACKSGGSCSDTCPQLYLSQCAAAAAYHVCQKAAGGCLAWDPIVACSPGLVCQNGLCVSAESVEDAQAAGSDDASGGGPDVAAPDLNAADAVAAGTDDGSAASDAQLAVSDGGKSDLRVGSAGGGNVPRCAAARTPAPRALWPAFLAGLAILGVRLTRMIRTRRLGNPSRPE